MGIPAEILPKICEVWMDANKASVLGSRQKVTAEKAERGDLRLPAAAPNARAQRPDRIGHGSVRVMPASHRLLRQFVGRRHDADRRRAGSPDAHARGRGDAVEALEPAPPGKTGGWTVRKPLSGARDAVASRRRQKRKVRVQKHRPVVVKSRYGSSEERSEGGVGIEKARGAPALGHHAGEEGQTGAGSQNAGQASFRRGASKNRAPERRFSRTRQGASGPRRAIPGESMTSGFRNAPLRSCPTDLAVDDVTVINNGSIFHQDTKQLQYPAQGCEY